MWKKCHWTYHALEPIGLACTSDGLLSLWAFVAHVLVMWNSSLSYQIFQMLAHFILHSHSWNITTNLIRKIFQYWEVVTVFVYQSSRFCLKAWILSLATNTLNCFYWPNRLTSFIFNTTFIRNSVTGCLSSFLFSFFLFRYHQCKCQQCKRQIMWYYYAGSFHLVGSLKRITNLETTLL